jgi:hypothetical protein
MRFHRIAIGAAVLSSAVAASAAFAAAGTEGAKPAAHKTGVSVIASGLDNPRGLTLAFGGGLLVAEAGRGGSGPCTGSPENPDELQCLGASGAITWIGNVPFGGPESAPTEGAGKPWRQRELVGGLPSLAVEDGSGATGPHHVSWYGPGSYVASIGLGGTPAVRSSLGSGARLLGTLVTTKFGSSKVSKLADLAAYEDRNDPDGNGSDSNPYGVLGTPFGAVATDAGGNTLLSVSRSGRVSTLAVFPNRNITPPPPPPPLPNPFPMQAVPTSVVRGPDGAFYVSQLTGFPFPAGAANIYRVVPGQKPTVYASGFTNVIDLAFDRLGRLLVLQLTTNGLAAQDPGPGKLVRIDRKGERTEVGAGALLFPGGIAVGRDNTYYVTNKSIFAGGGEVLRIRG